MRKVNLRMNEYEKYIKIKNLVETNGNKKRVAIELDISIKQKNSFIPCYKAYVKEFFIHENRNKIYINKFFL